MRKVIKELDLGLYGAEEDRLVLRMFEILKYTSVQAYQHGYKQGRFDIEIEQLDEPRGFSEDDAFSRKMDRMFKD
jgi:hypothetical protein